MRSLEVEKFALLHLLNAEDAEHLLNLEQGLSLNEIKKLMSVARIMRLDTLYKYINNQFLLEYEMEPQLKEKEIKMLIESVENIDPEMVREYRLWINEFCKSITLEYARTRLNDFL